ncbi:hypothetical protein [Myxococcus qinghaiensis]|uniref:hypothetical protein n=1 Tax=Myxococcus qinghaiensis TaxID=2906758 RepID=UPI0020A778A9|nr:hypothetical protein [Myxococcus qinghaiensis]MCP3161560.1 hypothetical protein [Myxococcus qinghaiensis]
MFAVLALCHAAVGALGEAGLVGRVLDAPPVQLAIADVDWNRLGAALVPWSGARRLVGLLETAEQIPGNEPGALAGMDEDTRRGLITQALCRIVARVMRTQEGALNPTQPLRARAGGAE